MLGFHNTVQVVNENAIFANEGFPYRESRVAREDDKHGHPWRLRKMPSGKQRYVGTGLEASGKLMRGSLACRRVSTSQDLDAGYMVTIQYTKV